VRRSPKEGIIAALHFRYLSVWGYLRQEDVFPPGPGLVYFEQSLLGLCPAPKS